MRSILGKILVGTLLTLAPATAWAQLFQPLSYADPVGAHTRLTGLISDAGNAACPPTSSYPVRFTGGDGTWMTKDGNWINTGGRTQLSLAVADANGFARALAHADTSSQCSISPTGSTFMSATGTASALFYQRYTVGTVPPSPQMGLRWVLKGSFSYVSSNWGGHAGLRILLLLDPPPAPVLGAPGGLVLVGGDLFATTGQANLMQCFGQPCAPVPNAAVIDTGGTIDLVAALHTMRGRPMATGDSFIIVGILQSAVQTCGFIRGCPVPKFTTDFSVSARIKTDVELNPIWNGEP